ncbi:hypothetical protein HC928_21875 [bacterium]|nr:hypothetical protein [bacterium]
MRGVQLAAGPVETLQEGRLLTARRGHVAHDVDAVLLAVFHEDGRGVVVARRLALEEQFQLREERTAQPVARHAVEGLRDNDPRPVGGGAGHDARGLHIVDGGADALRGQTRSEVAHRLAKGPEVVGHEAAFR